MSGMPYDEWMAYTIQAEDDYQAGGDIPYGHPDAYDEDQAEREYMHRYSVADTPLPLNVPVRVSDDFEPTDLDALREDLELFARAVSMPSIRKKAA